MFARSSRGYFKRGWLNCSLSSNLGAVKFLFKNVCGLCIEPGVIITTWPGCKENFEESGTWPLLSNEGTMRYMCYEIEGNFQFTRRIREFRVARQSPRHHISQRIGMITLSADGCIHDTCYIYISGVDLTPVRLVYLRDKYMAPPWIPNQKLFTGGYILGRRFNWWIISQSVHSLSRTNLSLRNAENSRDSS